MYKGDNGRMCPFCFAALAVVAAKAVAAAGGGAIVTKVVVNKLRHGDAPPETRLSEDEHANARD